jgi:hypothetical protein
VHHRPLIARIFIYLWASPTTALGLALLPFALLTGGRAKIVDGVLEVHGGIITLLLRRCTLLKGGASAMTFGHVVLARDCFCLDASRTHERVHVRQAERWGPFFIPAYLVASLIALLRGRRPYLDNHFEREAYGEA